MFVEVCLRQDQLFSKWGTGTRLPMTCSCVTPSKLSVPRPQLRASFLKEYTLVFNIYDSNTILGYHRLYIYILCVCVCMVDVDWNQRSSSVRVVGDHEASVVHRPPREVYAITPMCCMHAKPQ
jgi:hypothetical protein